MNCIRPVVRAVARVLVPVPLFTGRAYAWHCSHRERYCARLLPFKPRFRPNRTHIELILSGMPARRLRATLAVYIHFLCRAAQAPSICRRLGCVVAWSCSLVCYRLFPPRP